MRISIRDKLGSPARLMAGANAGRQLLSALIAENYPRHEPEVCFLDFRALEVATASYLRESVVAFRDYCRAHRPNLYPVVVNANGSILEELDDLLRTRGDALVACVLDDGGCVSDTRLLGNLDEKQRLTLAAVAQTGEADATTLASAHEDSETIGPTAWNNRLAALTSKGILIEERRGRAKSYRPVLEGL